MHFSTSLSLFSFISFSYTLFLPPSISLSNNSSNGDSLPNEPASLLNATKIICSSAWYGSDPKEHSCLQAWGKMPRSNVLHTYGPRGERTLENFDVTLPIRYLSDDGLCAIDLRQRGTLPFWTADTTSSLAISDNAKAVLDRCVSEKRTGGSTTVFSQLGELTVIVATYEPRVNCDPRPPKIPLPELCEKALNSTPTRRQAYVFLQQHDQPRPRPRNIVTLPKEFLYPAPELSPPDQCAVRVSTPFTSPPTRAAWFDLWAAGVEINTLCVQHGMTGSVGTLGENGNLTVEILVP